MNLIKVDLLVSTIKKNNTNCSVWLNHTLLLETCLKFKAIFFLSVNFLLQQNKIQKCSPNSQRSFISSGTNPNNNFILNQTTVLLYLVHLIWTANFSLTLCAHTRKNTAHRTDTLSGMCPLWQSPHIGKSAISHHLPA